MSSPGLPPGAGQPCAPSLPVSPPEIFNMVPPTSSQFTQEILPILQQTYLDSSSGSYFQYNQVTLVNNTKLLDQFNGYRLDLEEKGYNKEELAESFAFLLFETENQAKAVCQNGLKVGGSNITTLGDPLKGVYLCKYSDFLQPTPWYHGKCGYILILKIIKGRVKPMIENYTADLTGPSAGYNCHVSTNSDTVSSITSHFQAFELTQYYLYEFGQCDVLQYPRQIYPYAVVEFQYCDNKCMMTNSAENEVLVPGIQAEYHPWKGQLIHSGKAISVALKSSGSPLMPVVLPAELEIEYVMGIDELKSKLPQAVFERESYKLKEVCLAGLYCSWYELVEYIERGEGSQLGPFVDEMKKKNLAIVKCLSDQGLLVLFSASVSCFTGGSDQPTHNVLQAVFIFKESRISHLKGMVWVTRTLSQNRITPLLPGIGYAVMKGLKSAGARAVPRNKLVEDHLVEYFKMTPEQSTRANGVTADNGPATTTGAPSNKAAPPRLPGDCWGTRISQLSPYFANPASYILPISTVLKLQRISHNLSQSSGAMNTDSCHSRASAPKPPDAAFPRHKRISILRKVEGKGTRPVDLPPASTPPRYGTKSRPKARTNSQQCKAGGRAIAIGKPIVCKAVGKSPGKVTRKAAKPLLAGALGKPGAKAEAARVLKSSSCAAHSDVPSRETPSATTASPGYSTRSQSARNNKRTLKQSGEDVSAPEVKKKKPKTAGGASSQTHLKRANTARKGVGSHRGTGRPGPKKLSRQYAETGINTEQVSRYGVCTWNIVENTSENEPASLQPLSNGSNRVGENKIPAVAIQMPQEGVATNEEQTDALTILADLAINAAITAVLKSKRQCILTWKQAPEMCSTNVATSTPSKGQFDHCPSPSLLDSHGDCSPNTELRVQNIMSLVAESHQNAGGESSESQPSHSAASLDLESPPCVAPAVSSHGASQVHHPQTRVAKELARRSSAASRSSHPLGDHSYSRPPRDRESLSLAVANPVPAEKELVVCQYMPLPPVDLQNTPHASQLQSEVGSKDEERGCEERTLVGRVVPFRREDTRSGNVTNSTPTPQKDNGALGKDYNSADSAQGRLDEEFQCSRTVHEEKDTVKVTFKWKGPYIHQWDSKYTNDSLEKSVNRALHGPWDPTIQETMKEVKLILHMWIGLFYTKSSMLLQTSRQVQECCVPPEPAAGHRHEELAGVGEPDSGEGGSEMASSEKQQPTGVIVSSVIKRVEKKSNLVTSCDSDELFYREALPCASSQPREECLQGDESCINIDDMESPEAQSAITPAEHISAGEDCEQESTNDLHAARFEHGNQESNLSQRVTPASDERSVTDLIQYNGAQDTVAGLLEESDIVDTSQTDNRETSSVIKQTESIQQYTQDESEVLDIQSPSAQLSPCSISDAGTPGSTDGADDPVIDGSQLGIIRQSSVIKEMLGIQLPAEEPPLGKENPSSGNVAAWGSCQKLKESRVQNKRLENLAASEDAENPLCAEDSGTVNDTPEMERDASQHKCGEVDHSGAALQSFPFTNDGPGHNNTADAVESSNAIMHNLSRTLGSSENTAGPLVKGNTCSYVESCADVQLLKDDTETQRKRISVGKLQGDGTVMSDCDSEHPGSLQCMSPADECRSQMKLRATSSQSGVGILHAQQMQKEFEAVKQCNDFHTISQKSDCGRAFSKESAFSVGNISGGSEVEIQTGARGFYSKTMPRTSLKVSTQKRKRKVHREKLQCFSDSDPERGDFREQWSTRDDRTQVRDVDRNYLPDVFEENYTAEIEMSDGDAPVRPVIKILDPFGRTKTYQNFTVTAEARQKPDGQVACKRITRTFCNWQKESDTPQLSGQRNSSARCQSDTSPIEKILNLEYIHFSQHLHNVVSTAHAAPYASLVSSSRDGNKTALRRKRQTRTLSSGRHIGKRNALTVTILCRKVDQSSGRHLRNKTQTPLRTKADDGTWQQEDVAFYKPTSYPNLTGIPKRPGGRTHATRPHSIELADGMPTKPHTTGVKGSSFADELLNVKHKEYKEPRCDRRKRIDPFLSLITELCGDLHQSLNEVVKESWKGTYKFYVSETNSDPFFKEIKEFLKNEGHVEIGPLDLSMIRPRHSGKVLVIIRNEDISAHLHQIPHLVTLKRMPCVQFVGVDSPGDIKDQTFQELFISGGFVVSDETVLNHMTPEHLQQISAVLEQLSAEHKWKWMIHFKELKKLKETAREDNAAKRKISLLTRKIAANIVEILPFHECDSRSQSKPDHLSCLVKLQGQKISSRFAVFLTGNPENRDAFAQSGVLVTDINSFTKGLRMLTAPTQSTLATKNACLAEVGHSSEAQLDSSFGKTTVTQMPPTLF
ncbi:protein TASOR 2-like isoform X2 [Scyliorhinus canicula]|uniref:protein TASOR 2-like isoform X2 n=1 Tax=Scyliorhinus canicula TaxID=7830 RepID=UPI0018F5B336|nr:protein TASOR 2-like isoform X2 [Scyliorhinus canicula]